MTLKLSGCALEAVCDPQHILTPLEPQFSLSVKWGKGTGLWVLLGVASFILLTKSDASCDPMLNTWGVGL